MSWQDKINNVKFSITTGDGNVFTPLWKTTGKSKEFNTAIYDFINVEGSLVERKKGKSAKHSLVFYFQGENNIEDTAAFDLSASDNRLWTVEHPFYGVLKGQPLNIKYDESFLNSTTVTVDFWESINGDYPNAVISVKDSVLAKKDSVLAVSATVFASDIMPVSSDIANLSFANELTASSFNDLLDDTNYTDYTNAVARSLTAADSLISDAQNAIETAQNIVDLPSEFSTAISARLNSYVSAFDNLLNDIESVADKLFFESQAGSLVACICNAVVNPIESDYVLRTEIESTIDTLLDVYNRYLTTIDSSQVNIYSISDSYIPNVNIQVELSNLVSFTAANLYSLAFGSKQLRTVYTKKTTNVILLTHKYMGLASDENLDNFIKLNSIRLKELFVIKKGRKIKYFV